MALTKDEIKQILIDGFGAITDVINIDPDEGYDVTATAIFDAVQDSTPVSLVESFNGRTGVVVPLVGDYSTTIVLEGTNLYYTSARFDADFATKDTDDLTEGSTNLYFQEAPVDGLYYTRKDAGWVESAAVGTTFDDSNLPTEIQDLNLQNVQEALEYLLNQSINNFQVDPGP